MHSYLTTNNGKKELMRRMWSRYGYMSCMLIVAYSPAITYAEPQNGFGVYAGVIGATEGNVINRGVSLGVDAQFVINDKWSLNPYLMASAERSSVSTTASDELIGLQLRRWLGEWFIGVQSIVHDRLAFAGGQVQNSAYGVSPGFVAGFEAANGWGTEIQTDLLESTNTPGVWRNAVRWHLTYRWY